MRHHRLPLLSGVLAVAALFVDVVAPLPPPWHKMRVKHKWNTVPANWESLGPPPTGTTIDLYIALKPQQENALIDVLYEVSSPGHPQYGAHLSMDEVAKLVTPHPDTLELVNSWFEHHGVPPSSVTTTHGGGWLTLTGVPVWQANKLLGASYQLYRHAGTNDTGIIRTVSYALPTVLHTHVQTVAPTTCFASMRMFPQEPRRLSVGEEAMSPRVASRDLATVLSRRLAPPETLTPLQVRWLYKTSTYRPAATDKNALGIMGYSDQYPSPADLRAFMKNYRTDARPANFTVEKVNGGSYDPSRPGYEANLNVQYAQVIAYPTPNIYYSIGGQGKWQPDSKEPAPGDADLEWLNYILLQSKIPQTISTSYGIHENILPQEYTTAICDLFAQLGTRGVSVLFASGNDGVGPGDCKANGGSGSVQFVPVFPASCPWVTSVGGTASQSPEVAANFSGGGFSYHFPRPLYQKNYVPAFLKRLGRKYGAIYNRAGRGIPDIAAQSFCVVVINNNLYTVDGTSCAAPIVAGVISLLNDFLLSNGRAPLGFLNPWLYGEGFAGLNDITIGSNPGCDTDGFSAVARWDPVTGLGTPDFSKLLQILEQDDEL